MSSPALDGLPPLQVMTGQTPDISFLLHFSFWEPVYYRVNPNEPSSNFPSTSNEKKGYWVGFSDNVGDKLTWKILAEDTKHSIFRSAVRSANNTTPNLHHELPSGESNLPNSNPTSHEDSPNIPEHNFLWSQSECEEESSLKPNPTPMATYTVDDLIGRSFLLPSGHDSHDKTRATVTKKIEELDQDSANRGEHIKFLLKLNNQEDVEQVLTYNQLLDYLEKDESQLMEDSYWSFKDIIAHQGPLTKDDPHYKRSSYNVMTEWDTGETAYEPLCLIIQDDPISCAVYAKKHGLLNKRGWKHLKKYVKTSKRLLRAAKQFKLDTSEKP